MITVIIPEVRQNYDNYIFQLQDFIKSNFINLEEDSSDSCKIIEDKKGRDLHSPFQQPQVPKHCRTPMNITPLIGMIQLGRKSHNKNKVSRVLAQIERQVKEFLNQYACLSCQTTKENSKKNICHALKKAKEQIFNQKTLLPLMRQLQFIDEVVSTQCKQLHLNMIRQKNQ